MHTQPIAPTTGPRAQIGRRYRVAAVGGLSALFVASGVALGALLVGAPPVARAVTVPPAAWSAAEPRLAVADRWFDAHAAARVAAPGSVADPWDAAALPTPLSLPRVADRWYEPLATSPIFPHVADRWYTR